MTQIAHNGHDRHSKSIRRARRAELLPQMTRMHLEGKSYREIAKALGIPSMSTVVTWLAKWREEQLAIAAENNAAWVAKMLARYELVWREAMKAWHRSEADKIQCTTDTKDIVPIGLEADTSATPMAKERKRSKRTEAQAGDAALLAKAMDALKAIRELKGLDAPKQTQLTGPDGGPVQVVTRDMSDEELLRLIAAETQKENAICCESTPATPLLAD